MKMNYFPINQEKEPLVSDWKTHEGEPVGNYGIALPPEILVVDVDIKNKSCGDKSEDILKFQDYLPPTKIVTTASGGRHYYYIKPADVKTRYRLPLYPGIDFLSQGRYVVGEGTIIKGVKYVSNDLPIAKISPHLLELLRHEVVEPKEKSSENVNLKELEDLIRYLPDGCVEEYNLWVTVGMCLHDATGGALQGLNLWDEFSKRSKKYKLGACSQKWATFTSAPDKVKVGIGTLYHYALENGYEGHLGDLLPGIEDFKGKSKSELLNELDEWVYVSTPMLFYNTKDNRCFEITNIKLYYRMLWPSGDVMKRLVARLAHADNFTYIPGSPTIVKIDGKILLNKWYPGVVKPEAGNHQLFEEHLKYLLPKEWTIVRDWMAWIVQNPSRRHKWSIVFSGGSGVGKTYIAEVLRHLVGKHNVSNPSNSGMHEKYTHWAGNVQLVVVNEVMASGRKELTDKLKTLLTEDYIAIREMRSGEYTIKAVFNLIMLSNYAAPILISDDERRFCILYTNAKKREREYYEKLWAKDNVPLNLEAIYQYLLSVDLSNHNIEWAPDTQAKQRLIDSTHMDDWDMYITDWVKVNGREIFSLDEILTMLRQSAPTEVIDPHRVSNILRKNFDFIKRIKHQQKIIKLYATHEKAKLLDAANNFILMRMWNMEKGQEGSRPFVSGELPEVQHDIV